MHMRIVMEPDPGGVVSHSSSFDLGLCSPPIFLAMMAHDSCFKFYDSEQVTIARLHPLPTTDI